MVIEPRAALFPGLPLLLGLAAASLAMASPAAGLEGGATREDRAPASALPRCLFVSSYHLGNGWTDGIERGLRSLLDGKCEVRRFDMDSKRHKTTAEKRISALGAKAVIESWSPDVVIAADDNAAKYLVAPYYRDQALPIVFCGVNWTVEEYGFPYSNVTGMIEVAPIQPLLERAGAILPGARRLLYIGADTLTERKNLQRVAQVASALGLLLEHRLVESLADWIAAYREGQDRDLLFLGSTVGIVGWSDAAAQAALLPLTRRLSVTNHLLTMPVAILGMTKLSGEQGEWAGAAALSILAGTAPGEIPIVANSRRDIWVNGAIRRAAGIELPEELLRKAKRLDHLAADY